MKTEAIRIHRHGGPEVLVLEEVTLPDPAHGEARVRNTAVGVNYADIYEREDDHGGPHAAKPMPMTLGHLGVGVVEAVAGNAPTPLPGARVGYIAPAAYARHTLVPAARLFPLPDAISDEV